MQQNIYLASNKGFFLFIPLSNIFLIFICLYNVPLFAEPLDLKKLIHHALTHSPQFKSSINNLNISKIEVENALSRFLPSFDLETLNGYQNGEPQAPAEINPSELKLSLGSRLYDNGSNFINFDRAKYQKRTSKIEFERDRSLLCLELSQEYYNYSLAVKILEIQKYQYSLLKKQFKSIENQYHQGRKTRIDYIRFKAKLQRADLSMQQAEVTKSKSIEEIKKILNWKDSELEITVHKSNDLKEEVPQTNIEFTNHFEYRIANLMKSINQFNVTLERRKYWPALYFDVNGTYRSSEYLKGHETLSDNRQTNWSALLTLKFNIWDWGLRRRNIVIADMTRKNQNNSIDSKLLELRATINKLYLDLKQQQKNYLLNKELVELEKNNYNTIERSYRRGKSAFLDLINSLNDYTSSQESFYRNLFQLKSLIAEYKHHEGSLYETIQNN